MIEVRDRVDGWPAAAQSRLRAAIDTLRGEGTAIRLVRSITDPDDGSLMLIVETVSRAAIVELTRRADLHVRRIAEIVDVDVPGEAGWPLPERPPASPTRGDAQS